MKRSTTRKQDRRRAHAERKDNRRRKGSKLLSTMRLEGKVVTR